MKTLAIIPARSGSKSILHKNIQSLGGKPLMAYSIQHALESEEIDRVIVSTDSAYYADIAKSLGAEVPFLRPSDISSDESTDYEVLSHALRWLDENERYRPKIIVHLRPTSPHRKKGDIDAMVKTLKNSPELDSMRSITEHKDTVFKMWFLRNGLLEPAIKSSAELELYNEPRQKLERTYIQNACIDVTRYETIMRLRSITGKKIGAYLMDYFGDIDEWIDFKIARKVNVEKVTNKVFCVDIDGIIAALTPDNNYEVALPLVNNIDKINKLFNNGNRIVLFTARGSLTKIDWQVLTEKQLNSWGVKYHELKFAKPAADFYIDDRMLDLNDIEFN